MSLNHLSDSNYPTRYLNLNVGGVKLDNNVVAGYNASNLNAFEEYTKNFQFKNFDATLDVPNLIDIKFQRLGNVVELIIDYSPNIDAGAGFGAFIQNAGDLIPERFRPLAGTKLRVPCNNTRVATDYIGLIEVDDTGLIQVFFDVGGAVWTGATNRIQGANVKYFVN